MEAPTTLLSDLLQAVPKLVDRTRNQAELARSLAGYLPCLLGRGAEPDGELTGTADDTLLETEHEHVDVDVLSLLEDDAAGSIAPTSAPPGDAAPASTPTTPAPLHERDLPVQDYDSLAASQVVPRLATMSPEDLRVVRDYELAHRHRQTILNRVAQLLGD